MEVLIRSNNFDYGILKYYSGGHLKRISISREVVNRGRSNELGGGIFLVLFI